jgi:hypothetical protein
MIRLVVLILLAAPAFSSEDVLERIVASGRVQTIGVASSDRLRPDAFLAPGDAPLLRFRYLDGKRRHRFGDLDLVMDDAGH